jgi:hypothetical protein
MVRQGAAEGLLRRRGTNTRSPSNANVRTLQAAKLATLLPSVSFKIMDAPVLELPAGEAAQLGLHLAVFGSEEEMPRWRLLAEKIAVAVSQAERGDASILHLTESQRRDISLALDAMIDDRAGNLSDELLAVRASCR